jgi:hypothetical protein
VFLPGHSWDRIPRGLARFSSIVLVGLFFVYFNTSSVLYIQVPVVHNTTNLQVLVSSFILNRCVFLRV